MTDSIILLIDQEIARLTEAKALLSAVAINTDTVLPELMKRARPKGSGKKTKPVKAKRKPITAESRQRMAEAQRKRHAGKKTAKKAAPKKAVAKNSVTVLEAAG